MALPSFVLGAVLTLCGFFSWIPFQPEQEPNVVARPRRPEIGRTQTPSLRADVNLILVPVSVADALDRPVTNLTKDSFRLTEDGVEQKITSFAREEAPVSLGLLFDSSGSMKSRMQGSITALRHLFQTTLPGDEFFLVQFADQARLLGGFTPNPEEIERRLGFVEPKGWTALLDSLAMGAHQMRTAKNRRRVLVVLSDGNDNNSRFTETEIRNMVIESDVRVYAIGLFYRPRLLRQLAEETGGKVLVAQNLAELPDVVRRLSSEIRTQYLLGYTPSNAVKDGKYHKVKVEVVQEPGAPRLQASWRRGYFAPGDDQ